MKYIYNIKNKRIREKKNGSKEIDLTVIQGKFIEALCNGHINKYKDIADYMYVKRREYYSKRYNDAEHEKYSIQTVKSKLKDVINLDIVTHSRIGLELRDNIYIEY